ncbi:unnamed protein product, partial [marine sediment metagenome]
GKVKGNSRAASDAVNNTLRDSGISFDEFLNQRQEEVGQTFGAAKRSELRTEFENSNLGETAQKSDFDPVVQLMIDGVFTTTDITQTERKKLAPQILQAKQQGLITTEDLTGDEEESEEDPLPTLPV